MERCLCKRKDDVAPPWFHVSGSCGLDHVSLIAVMRQVLYFSQFALVLLKYPTVYFAVGHDLVLLCLFHSCFKSTHFFSFSFRNPRSKGDHKKKEN